VQVVSLKISTPHLFVPQTSHLVIANRGTIPWTGAIRLEEGHRVLAQHQMTLAGDTSRALTMHWVPPALGTKTLSVTANRHIIEHSTITVTAAGRPVLLDLSPDDPGHFAEVALLLALMLWTVSFTWRRISWTPR
jgi:hypothetical protein